MKTRPFGPTGHDVPIIGQGTWQLRRPDQAEAALRLGLDLGLTHIDTAELYTGSEEVVGRVVRSRRKDVFLVTKVRPPNTSYARAVASIQGSLQRLSLTSVDVILQHWNDGRVPLSETMRALAEAQDQGWTRHVGVSNFEVAEMEKAQAALGRRKIVCNQVYYSPERREAEHDVLPYCRANGIALVAYSPFGSGRFPAPTSPGGRALASVGARRSLTPHQVALAFVTRLDGVFTIPKAESLAHVRENAAALERPLSREDVSELEAAFSLGTSRQLPSI